MSKGPCRSTLIFLHSLKKYKEAAMHKKSKALSRLGIFLIFTSIISFIVFYLVVMISQENYSYVDVDTLELVQTQEIEQGAPIAIIRTTAGEMRAVLYPEQAPKTVESFIALAESGYYNDSYVFEQKADVYFAAGSPNPDGSLGDQGKEEYEKIPRELHQNLWPFKGALCVMNTTVEGGFFDRLFGDSTYYTGSRFMVIGSMDFEDEAFVTEFREASGSELIADAFIERGGVPNFSQQQAVFGQVYAGFDVLDALLAAEVEETTNAGGYTPPVEECRILEISIGSYSEEDAAMNELP
ncbi:MAG: peptidylprolyl isomerase [Ruminococcus sp.]|nr:peptidylprolyl isomerase [Ruminococcus sp.]